MQTTPIIITSFYPFENFLRVTNEFYDNKVVVNTKSLTYESELEFSYDEISQISDIYRINEYQINSAIGLLAIMTVALILFFNNIHENPILLTVVQAFYICGLLVLITGFRKSWKVIFSDNKGNIQTSIKQTAKNAELISQAAELIKSKVEGIQEISAANPFPDEKPIFELVQYNIIGFEKTTDKFYRDEYITLIQTAFKETAYSTSYSRFSGKVFRARVPAINWFLYFCNSMYIWIIIMGLQLAFDVGITIKTLFFLKVLLVLFLVLWLLSFTKREVIGLYDHDKHVTFGHYTNRKNRAKVDEIIKFVQSKIPTGGQDLEQK